MGALTDKDILIDMFQDNGIYTPRAIRNMIRRAPEIQAYPLRKTELERRIVNASSSHKMKVVHVCKGCEHALPDMMLPQTVKFCYFCGRKVMKIVDSPDALER